MAKRPIYFDTETTGMRPESDRIIELALFDPVKKLEKVWLINPKMPIPKEATHIHKITDDMVASSPLFSEVAQECMEFCDGDVALIGHNCDAFDVPFLLAEFSRNHLQIPPHWAFVDSLKWARKYRKDLPRHSLQFLRQMYGIAPNQAHRALNDVYILHEVFRVMTDDLTCEEIIQLIGHTTFNKAQKPMMTLFS